MDVLATLPQESKELQPSNLALETLDIAANSRVAVAKASTQRINSQRILADETLGEGIALTRSNLASWKALFFSPNSRMLWGLCTIQISVCSGRAGAVPGRNRVPGTGSGNWFRQPPGFDGFRQVLRFQGSGSEGRVKEVSKVSVFDGFRGVRFCSQGFDGTVSGNRVPGTRGIKKVPGQGFRQLLCTSKVYACTLKVYSCTLNVYFCTFKVHFWTLKVYLLYFANILLYFATMLEQRKGGN